MWQDLGEFWLSSDLQDPRTCHLNKLGAPLVTVDIWRFDGAGKVTEHWDVLEADFTSPSGHAFPG